ncbi:MAG: hypothetical protein VR68_03225 [Peptococcaceae bacterium BRH_c4a]|nr:MAG: hypothetical protein VR68_03225 [Peptococcaceae bacterium BRH_c4a]
MKEPDGTKREFRPGPGRLNLAERLMGYGVLVLLTLLIFVLYLPGPSSAQTGSTGSVLLCNEIPGFNVSPGATYFTKKTNVYYHGGTVLLAAQSDGSGNISVDDALEITVTHEDGTTATLSYVFAIRYPPWMITSPPIDITHLFKEGLNSFHIRLYDIYGGMAGSTSLWITSVSLPVSGSDAAANIAMLNHNDREESYIADPVDAATGAHVIRRKLMNVNGAVPIDFRVHYNSLLLKEGSMGRGWGHDHQARLEVQTNGNIDLRWTANRVNHFTPGSGQYKSTDLATLHDTLVKNTDGSHTLTRKDQREYQFNPAGQLTEQKNGHGQSLIMAYDGSGRLTRVTEPLSGQFLTFQYNTGDLLESVTDSMNRRVSFTCDTNGNLTEITDANGQTTTYTYNGDGRVLTATDAEGRQLFSNIYDQLGRVISQDDAVPGNQLTRFIYDETSQPGKIITTVTGRDGQAKVFTHDSKYHLLSIKDELSNTTSCAYDADGNRISVTDAASRSTGFIYDTRGNLTTVTDPAGHITTMTYDQRNNLHTLENAAGKRITYTYDSNNNPLSVTDPLSNTTGYTYDASGLLTGKTTPGLGTTTYTYTNGLLYRVADPEGNTATFGYDGAGRVTGITDGAGNTTSMTYDSAGCLLSVADPLGNTRRYTYDSHGNMLSETDPMGNLTRYEYNGNGKLVSLTDPLNNRTACRYDGEDRLVGITDARGNASTIACDARGRVTAVTDPLGNATSYQYDTVDNLIGRRDAIGNNILNISYDSLNNPLAVTDALGRTVNSQYDILNRLTAVTDPLGRVTRFNYDDLNRLVSTADPAGGQAKQTFDTDGNRISLTDPNNNQTGFTFDRAGRITVHTSASGSTAKYGYNAQSLIAQVTNGRDQTANYQYNPAGRLTSVTDQAGTVTCTYDANGNVLAVTDPGGTITREYDPLNRVKKYTDAKGNIIQYEYDPVGNLTSLTYPGGKQAGYRYDAANRLTMVTDWAGRITSYEYDPNGRLTKTTRPDGTEQTNTYDAAGQLLQQKDVDFTGNVIAQYDYTYDGAGNVTKEQSPVPTQPFNLPAAAMTYTTDNRLATYNGQPAEYDADGNMTKGPLGGVMGNYTFDCRNRLTSTGSASYQYDAENNRISVANSINGGRTDNVINPNAYLSQVLISTDEKGSQTFYVYGLGLIGQEAGGDYHTCHYDRRGSTVALTDASGKVTDRFQYEPYGTLTHRTGTTSIPFQYNGRFGVMTDANGLYHMRARYYNPEIKRFINRDLLLGSIVSGQSLNRYAYVNGNPVSYVDPFGLSRADSDYINSFELGPLYISPSDVESYFTNEDLKRFYDTQIEPVVDIALEYPPIGGKIKAGASAIRAVGILKMAKGAGKAAGRACFTEDTPVLTGNGQKPIKDVKIGDYVYSEDPYTGEKGLKRVKRTFIHDKDALVILNVGGMKIETTHEHPFWIVGKEWVDAGDLKVGDKVLLYSGEQVEVTEMEKKSLAKPIKVYNFEVEDWHTYFVSKDNVLVHNKAMPFEVPTLPSNARVLENPQEVYRRLEQYHGIDPKVASERLHQIKANAVRGADDNVLFDMTGNVYDPVTREWLGSLTEGGAKFIR